ncbi:MAG: T9SS type A sorting domain-containing protein, partial [Cryomorphaceae bacterium]|nr:T9SS type A sorting domain-containing protein [Cryomorphaceae bacterium]
LLAGGGVGIEEHGSGMEGLKVYPNPAKDKITYFLNETDELFVSLSDISGRVVLTKKGSGSQNLDISSFAKGSYSLRIASAKGIVTRKIILE